MNLRITNKAAKWYKEEFEADDQSCLRFFVRYGFGGQIPGFTLAVAQDTPVDIYASNSVEGITFFIESKDAWYFDGKDLTIQLNERKQEPVFIYS
ncbi:Uncharacterized protein YneR [Lentibacillus halodurans]|uniref:Uncharacterized protein YneR n=1 Tax=Lentibacillus halodurans TaxID=237679 RepID=A0A1I0VHP5_9BACI|nr:HesB/YadR/YfhF family protein [Lentibacillus halodurans]SFA75460.1 Uncharacterized protein YneR [Lentibacillus halodurans]